MPPKGKGKKGKKQDDDWTGTEVSIPGLEALNDDFIAPSSASKQPQASPFASLNDEEVDPFAGEDMGGGLMGAIQAASKKKKKEKKTKIADEDHDLESPSTGPAESQVVKTADELADEEWALPVKGKGKTKGKKSKGKADDEEEVVDETPSISTPAPADTTAAVAGDESADEDAPNRVLTKKEKEKLKKERDKAKKKAQAEAKKAELANLDATLDAPSADASTHPPIISPSNSAPPTTLPTADAEDEDDDAEAETGAKSDKKKKKKKKPAAKEEAKPAAKKKPAAGVAALKALMEQQKAAQEEARKKEEEERQRIEEEERLAAEEERLREEAKQRKKEKEKAKRELAKKEGRLLTDKQKREKAQAEVARQALINSGVRIEGLLDKSTEPSSSKRIVYGNKKKKPAPKDSTSITASSIPSTPTVAAPSLPDVTPSAPSLPVEDPSPTPESEIPGVKDDWDASTDEDEEPSTTTKPEAPSPPIKPINGSATPKTVTPAGKTASVPVKKVVAVRAAAGEESESSPEDTDSGSDDSVDDSDEGSDDDSDEESSDEELSVAQKLAAARKAEAAERRAERHQAALAARSKDDLRSPICCILGHVDTGKTKLLDKIRQTNVQEGEAGGITQQIGATYFPVSAIKEKTAVMNREGNQEYKIPGLLVIDTPGHESFTNLRSRGSSLCNIAVLVVDIMHGLEPQTLESLRLLRDKKTPFVVALNKIDRMYGWTATPDGAFRESLAKQTAAVQREFSDRYEKIVVAFAEQGLNAVLYYDNKNMARNVSIVPTSAVTGEGVPDMIMLLVHLTQTRMSDNLMYLSELECTILEVKIIEGLGTTIDVVLSNGVLHEGDKIVLCGLNGPIVTQIRALLTPQPMRELRIKSAYVHHKEVKAALGVKITAPDLEKAVAGSRLMVVGPDDDEEDLRDEVMSDLTNLLSSVDRTGRGVSVQASTLGSLEALLEFLKVSKIPVASIGIGPVHKRDIMQAATMVEKAKELACVLCFDVSVDKDAERIAEEYGIKIFKADIIYHLFDAFTAYNAQMVEAKRKDAAPQAIWPCRLKIIAVFTKRDPIILGVDIIDGSLRVGTPLCVVKKDPVTGKTETIPLGKITSLEINHKTMDVVKKTQAGGGVAVKIEHAVYQSAKMYGRHFDDKDELLSHITRQSIDVMKESFRNDVSKEEWLLIKGLKTRLSID